MVVRGALRVRKLTLISSSLALSLTYDLPLQVRMGCCGQVWSLVVHEISLFGL